LPSGGVVIGLALLMRGKPGLENLAPLVISIIIGASVIHEILGPIASKLALKKAGEI
jgi:hypothetical protein